MKIGACRVGKGEVMAMVGQDMVRGGVKWPKGGYGQWGMAMGGGRMAMGVGQDKVIGGEVAMGAQLVSMAGHGHGDARWPKWAQERPVRTRSVHISSSHIEMFGGYRHGKRPVRC